MPLVWFLLLDDFEWVGCRWWNNYSHFLYFLRQRSSQRPKWLLNREMTQKQRILVCDKQEEKITSTQSRVKSIQSQKWKLIQSAWSDKKRRFPRSCHFFHRNYQVETIVLWHVNHRVKSALSFKWYHSYHRASLLTMLICRIDTNNCGRIDKSRAGLAVLFCSPSCIMCYANAW